MAKKDATAANTPVTVSAAKSANVALDLAKQPAAQEAKEKERLACVCVCFYVVACICVAGLGGRSVVQAAGRRRVTLVSPSLRASSVVYREACRANTAVQPWPSAPLLCCPSHTIDNAYPHRMPGRGLRERHPHDHCRVVQGPREALPLQAAREQGCVQHISSCIGEGSPSPCGPWTKGHQHIWCPGSRCSAGGGGGEVTRLGPGLDQCLDCLDPLEKGSLLCYSLRQRALGEGGR